MLYSIYVNIFFPSKIPREIYLTNSILFFAYRSRFSANAHVLRIFLSHCPAVTLSLLPKFLKSAAKLNSRLNLYSIERKISKTLKNNFQKLPTNIKYNFKFDHEA